jgi:hypothetical protein
LNSDLFRQVSEEFPNAMEKRCIRRDDDGMASVAITLIRMSAAGLRVAGIIQDITERKRRSRARESRVRRACGSWRLGTYDINVDR